jgi:succinyl-CoA synthetase alpha subunit
MAATNMMDGIAQAAAELIKVARVQAIVIVTDGMPDSPEAALATALQAKESGSIAIGTDDGSGVSPEDSLTR